jgi:hypothetical protein
MRFLYSAGASGLVSRSLEGTVRPADGSWGSTPLLCICRYGGLVVIDRVVEHRDTVGFVFSVLEKHFAVANCNWVIQHSVAAGMADIWF